MYICSCCPLGWQDGEAGSREAGVGFSKPDDSACSYADGDDVGGSKQDRGASFVEDAMEEDGEKAVVINIYIHIQHII
jgi:hypothetical protein